MHVDDLVRELGRIVGPTCVSTTEPDRIAYSADMWPRAQIWKTRGEVMRHPPDCVAWPSTVEEVAGILKLCDDHAVPVVPYGAGSGVCGGTVPIHGGVVVDVRRLDAIHSIDGDTMLVDVGPGLIGHHLEQALNEKGFTLGHFPSSILCSTVGGWVAARSAGQLSSKYGKIEDMVMGLEMALPGGDVLRTGELGPIADSMDWTPIFVGSEGTLGIVTRVLLRIHPAPELRLFRGMRFRSIHEGLDGMRRVMQAGLGPAVFRLYDAFDTLIAGSKRPADVNEEGHGADVLFGLLVRRADAEGQPAAPGRLERLRARVLDSVGPAVSKLRHAALREALTHPSLMTRIGDLAPVGCRLIVGFEGEAERTKAGMKAALELLTECGGSDQGEEPGKHWFEHRYDVSFKQSKIFYAGAFNDTMEVAVPWSRVMGVYDAVRRSVSQHGFIMAHFSHAYPEGCSIYFTFAGYRESPNESEELYDRIWSAALRTASAEGATLSHHHGIGLAKRALMAEEHGEGEHVFAALKRTFDPNGIMNPGKVFAGRYHKGRRSGTAG